jgi:hypothetical protein
MLLLCYQRYTYQQMQVTATTNSNISVAYQ